MPFDTYRSLPLDILYQLLTIAVRDLIAAYEIRENNPIAFRSMKKQVEAIMDIIEEKRKI